MTTAIYFNEMPTQRNARGISERIGDRNSETVITYVRKAKPNLKIKKLRTRLIIMKMQVKNFDTELLRLHQNWGHGTPESALGNSLSSRPDSIKLS